MDVGSTKLGYTDKAFYENVYVTLSEIQERAKER